MSHLARALVLAMGLVTLSAAPAHAGTIVFDFEDGLQGWELEGSAQRVQTQLLGGEWAIFGDGFLGGSLSIAVDLTDIVSISVERFLVGGYEDGLGAVVIEGLGTNEFPFTGAGFFTFRVVDPGNPNLLAIDVGSVTGVGLVEIRWTQPFVEDGPSSVVAFIDNVTFHTIPEPSVLGMLVMGGVAVLARRRARRGRHV